MGLGELWGAEELNWHSTVTGRTGAELVVGIETPAPDLTGGGTGTAYPYARVGLTSPQEEFRRGWVGSAEARNGYLCGCVAESAVTNLSFGAGPPAPNAAVVQEHASRPVTQFDGYCSANTGYQLRDSLVLTDGHGQVIVPDNARRSITPAHRLITGIDSANVIVASGNIYDG